LDVIISSVEVADVVAVESATVQCIYATTIYTGIFVMVKSVHCYRKKHRRATGRHLPSGVTQCYLSTCPP